MPTVFNGQFIVQPQASVAVDDSQLLNLNPGAQNVLAIVGTCTAGVPQRPVLVSDPTTARSLLRSGDLLNATLLAFSPSAETGGATNIYVVRANSATSSSARVLDVAGTKATGTLTVGGTFAGGVVLTATIGGVLVSYTTQAGDTNISGVATSLALAINTNAALGNSLTGVTATAVAAVITLTARTAGVDGNAITTVSTGTGVTLVASAGTLTTGTGNTLITITSDDYGLYTSQIYFKFAAGSVSGIKATVGLTTVGNIVGGTVTQDNLARPLLQVQYIGTAGTCTATVNDTAFVTTSATVGESLNLLFATYTTVQNLADYLNATGIYQATVLNNNGTYTTASQFDNVSAVNIKASAVSFNANLQALIDWLNAPSTPFISAARAVNPLAVLPYFSANNQFLVGGTEGTSTVTDWTNSIASLQNVDCQIIIPTSTNASIHAAVSTHCSYMAGPGRMPRVGICGGALGEYLPNGSNPVATIVARATALNTDRILLASPGISYYDVNQNLQVASSCFTAALYAGMLAAVAPGVPLTHKYPSNVVALETTYTPSDLNTLLLGGISPLQYVQNKGYRICQSRTTWTQTTSWAHTEISTKMAIDTVSRRVQDALDDDVVGQVVSPITLALAVSVAETILKQATTDNLIVGDANSPSYQNITASTGGGDTINVSFQISPAIPANYVLVNISTVPYVGSASVSSTVAGS